MEAERSWYYLQHSRQLGPCTWNELQDLLAMNVISPATLVWRRGGAWRSMEEVASRSVSKPAKRRQRSWILVVGAIIFCAAMSFEAELATRGNSGQQISDFFPLTTSADSAQALDHIVDPVITSSVNAIATAETKAQAPSSSMFEKSRPSVMNPSRLNPRQKSHLVQEYWRAISHSKVIGRYEYYLRRAPAGSFAQIAAARIEELRKEPPKRAARVRKRPAAKQIAAPAKAVKVADAKAVTEKLVSNPGEARCWTRNIEACRQKCRAGDHRSCQKLRRLGG